MREKDRVRGRSEKREGIEEEGHPYKEDRDRAAEREKKGTELKEPDLTFAFSIDRLIALINCINKPSSTSIRSP